MKKELHRRYDVVFTPNTTDDYREYSIREVDSQKIGHYVTIKGIITRVGEMLPMVRVATYICRECGYENYQQVSFPSCFDCRLSNVHSLPLRSVVVRSVWRTRTVVT